MTESNLQGFIYLTNTQYAELVANGSITVNGTTITYNKDTIYITEDDISIEAFYNPETETLIAKKITLDGKDLTETLNSLQNSINTINTNVSNIHIPTNVGELNNDMAYVTIDGVRDVISSTPISTFDNDISYATEDYVNANGGKIDSISVNGVAQTIDANKNVDIQINLDEVNTQVDEVNTQLEETNTNLANLETKVEEALEITDLTEE